MNINKNTLFSVFIFLGVLNSPLLFTLLLVPKGMETNLTAVMYLLGAVALSFINLKTTKERTLSRKGVSLLKIIMIGLLGIIISWFLQTVIGMFEIIVLKQAIGSQNTQNIANMVRSSPFFILAVTIAGPIMEEFVFRFSLINFLNQKLNIWFSAIISSAIFSVMHGDGHFLLYGSLGLFFFLLYKKTGSVLTSIIAHAGMNTLVILLQLMMN